MDPTSAIPEAALRLLLDQGFDATSVDELAMAAGMSRSTFFRRFGSKESMVFADHDAMLELVDAILEAGRADPATAVVAAALAVFDHHTARPEASLLRHRLLQEVPSLRDRELVSTHRYERAFRRGLEAAAGAGQNDAGPATGPAVVAFAAGVVAVHNAHLRRWLREPGPAVRSDLAFDLEELARLFGPSLPGPAEPALFTVHDVVPPSSRAPRQQAAAEPPAPEAGPRPAVVVTVLDTSAGTEDILDSVRRALGASARP